MCENPQKLAHYFASVCYTACKHGYTYMDVMLGFVGSNAWTA